jgi:SAM-dependent methyltransferase
MVNSYNHRAAGERDAWYRSETGLAVFKLQKDLILRLVRPRPGERLLDVGCGAGLFLQMFKREGLTVTGLDPSSAALALARERMGLDAGLMSGPLEDLPFEDNEFDLVTMINCLECTHNPKAALAEAFRVARRLVFVAVLNNLSLTSLGRRLKGLLRDEPGDADRYFSYWELADMIHQVIGPTQIRWATVGFFPPALASRVSSFEAMTTVQQLPFGAFLGMAADIVYTIKTDNLRIDTGLKLATKTAPTPTGCGSFPPGMPSGRRPFVRSGRHTDERSNAL